MKRIIIVLTMLLSMNTAVFAEKQYVTDRILLGIHAEADEDSSLIKSVPSGTELNVIGKAEGFLKVKLEDGTEGWVSAGFVMKETPSTRKYDVLAHQYEQTTQELDKLKEQYEKNIRELQVRRDQVSNATTTIKELQGRVSGDAPAVDPELENKLAASVKEIETLKAKIAEMEKQPEPEVSVDQKQVFNELRQVKEQNELMNQRVEVALAHLTGKRIPTAEELASIRPQFPTWYWTLLFIILIAGIIAGYFIMDYRFRRRHGGFRL